MTLDEIKISVQLGYNVHWYNSGYRVIQDNIGQWLIKCNFNGHCIGLTHRDGVALNGDESEFYIAV